MSKKRKITWGLVPKPRTPYDEWATPKHIFEEINNLFHFDLDVCASSKNFKVENYFDKEANALNKSWKGKCWMNPPYSDPLLSMFLHKAHQEVAEGHAEFVVCLLPSWTDAAWFHDFIDVRYCIFLPFRIGFLNIDGYSQGEAKFASFIYIIKELKDKDFIKRCNKLKFIK